MSIGQKINQILNYKRKYTISGNGTLLQLLCAASFLLCNILFTSSILAQEKTLTELDTIDPGTVYITKDSMAKLEPKMAEVNLGGQVYSAIITEEGDTLILVDMDGLSITSPREFADDKEYRKYLKQKRYANMVYPYAREAIRIFRELEYATQHMSKKEKKKKIKELQKELKAEFEQPLKKLTKLQGKILVKMIERELDETMYNLLKGLRGRFTAFYWHNFSKLYSYDLKEGYQYGKYPILDAVLQDFDISYRVEKGSKLKYVKIKE